MANCRRLTRGMLILFATLVVGKSALSQDIYVPEPLKEWQGWVLDGKEYHNCAFYFDRTAQQPADFVCAWPGTLELQVTAQGGEFSQDWQVQAGDAWLPLPGNEAYWPDAVTANGNVLPVVLRNGVPSLRVPAGNYRVKGHFAWDSRPGVLAIPPQSGLISLSLDGQRVARPEFSGNSLFLGQRQRTSEAEDKLTIQVYRLVIDDIPTRLLTRVQFDVAGTVREEMLGELLPDGFVPLTLESALPARLEADGELRVQLRPGRWELTLAARAPEVLDALALADISDATAKFPDSEIWSYQANGALRVTAAEGASPVDPAQVGVPGEWQLLPAFRMGRGDSLTITERSRGAVGAGNELTLNREMWLDFDGHGFTVLDHLSGTMRSGWRLDMREPYELKNAREGDQDLLITAGGQESSSGVEVRATDLSLTALGRSDTRGSLPTTGWDARFADVGATLYLPPGNKLLLARGADAAYGSWVGHWKLLDFFLLLIITIAAGRLFGLQGGAIALFALLLSFHEPYAPSWLWLNLLAAIALLRVAPVGRLQQLVRSYFGVSALLLVLALVPFVASQLRIAIYPQLEAQNAMYGHGGFADALRAPASAPPAESMDAIGTDGPMRKAGRLQSSTDAALLNESSSMEELLVSGSSLGDDIARFDRYAPNSLVQAGAGIPAWHWNSYRLSWSGPVEVGQNLHLVILPRWAVSLIRFIEVALLLLFAAVFAAHALKRRWRLPGGLSLGRAATSMAVVGLIGVLSLTAPTADAQTPAPELLKDLEQRLLEPPACAPRCAEISNAVVTASGDTVRIQLSISALEEVAIPLPGSRRGWQPDTVSPGGNDGAKVLRGDDQLLWLRVRPGQQVVTLTGAAGTGDSVEIAFPTPPRVIAVRGDGWSISGIKDSRLLSGSLQLARISHDASRDGGAVRWESNRFPPFVRINRRIDLAVDWRVMTSVERVAPAEGALTLQVPLLPGESVLSESMQVKDGKLLVTMNANQASVSWQSTLPLVSPLVLSAEAGAPWQDNWYVAIGSIWHASFSGVPESDSRDTGKGVRTAEFHPRGGETLTIDAFRPEAVAGSPIAFDKVDVAVEQGARSRTSNLTLDYRSTRGAQHAIALPADAELARVTIDGRDEPLRADAGQLTLPILPGEHTINVEWREDGDVSVVSRTPIIDIGAPASNIGLALSLPENRWLLLTSGPRLGPAVLYWSELAVLVLFAFLLAKIGWTPLRFHHWLLLGLGFSTFSWGVLALVALWLLVVSARDKWRVDGPWWVYNLMQVAVIALTVIAMVAIVSSLPSGLLGAPNMQVTGNGSFGNHLSWFADRTEALTPTALAVSAPMWVYKALILAWALWLSLALTRWLPWAWQCFARDGFFRSRRAAIPDTAT
ncbi:MAG TPA: hypothetical protein PKK10_12060 [Woeseiaceae bacterium]|nr:hypothetical protein [Woeseiaceae bacterium]